MKKQFDYTIILTLLCFVVFPILVTFGCQPSTQLTQSESVSTPHTDDTTYSHKCFDITHELCEENCECDGMGCGYDDSFQEEFGFWRNDNDSTADVYPMVSDEGIIGDYVMEFNKTDAGASVHIFEVLESGKLKYRGCYPFDRMGDMIQLDNL